jgi:predicted dehydrogenase
MLDERPGTVVILSGRNREKMERIRASVGAGLHVLADKPWILKSADLPALESTLAQADAGGVVAYDIMTERFEITNILQRALVNDEATFGEIVRGSEADPAVRMESVHYLKKLVSGAPNIRPLSFFDTSEQGEGLNDVGTHLVDLVQWTLFPEQALDYRVDVDVLAAERWPTWITEAEFGTVTNAPGFPDSLGGSVRDGRFEFYCNTRVSYALRGIHARLTVIWDWEAKPGEGDSHVAVYRGTRSQVEVRTTQVPELYVVPATVELQPQVRRAVQAKVRALEAQFAAIDVEDRGAELRITIPNTWRVGHEAHFAQVTRNFLDCVRDRTLLPAWERPNMLAKYYLTTTAVELSRGKE